MLVVKAKLSGHVISVVPKIKSTLKLYDLKFGGSIVTYGFSKDANFNGIRYSWMIVDYFIQNGRIDGIYLYRRIVFSELIERQ